MAQRLFACQQSRMGPRVMLLANSVWGASALRLRWLSAELTLPCRSRRPGLERAGGARHPPGELLARPPEADPAALVLAAAALEHLENGALLGQADPVVAHREGPAGVSVSRR